MLFQVLGAGASLFAQRDGLLPEIPAFRALHSSDIHFALMRLIVLRTHAGAPLLLSLWAQSFYCVSTAPFALQAAGGNFHWRLTYTILGLILRNLNQAQS